MIPKPDPNLPKSSAPPPQKVVKGSIETGRLFVNVEQLTRKSQKLPLTRYVE